MGGRRRDMVGSEREEVGIWRKYFFYIGARCISTVCLFGILLSLIGGVGPVQVHGYICD